MAKESPVLETHNNNVNMGKPSISDVLENAKGTNQTDAELPKEKRHYKPRQPKPQVEPAPQVLPWNDKNVQLILDSPFNLGYLIYGEEHHHWQVAKDNAVSIYPVFTQVLNDLQLKNPVYLMLAVALSEYLTIVGGCIMKSNHIKKSARTTNQDNNR